MRAARVLRSLSRPFFLSIDPPCPARSIPALILSAGPLTLAPVPAVPDKVSAFRVSLGLAVSGVSVYAGAMFAKSTAEYVETNDIWHPVRPYVHALIDLITHCRRKRTTESGTASMQSDGYS